ncbi:MAG TPA: tRNA (adenosine(37)-N6)-threonylcarbamoyltransferase complex dimerization subunit type 1 TsaB [Balneolaceae bacterium]
MLLALETATNVCSVAFCDSEGSIFEKRIDKRGSHSEQLFLFIEELMNEHDFKIEDLDAVLVSEGPGSYTGLRIGASAVKGLLFQSGVSLFGVNTLASFATQAAEGNSSSQTVHSIIDARRKHVYHQSFFCNEGLAAKSEVEVIPIKSFEAMVKEGDVIIGTGLDRIEESVKEKVRTFGKESITAKSLIFLYQSGEGFINEVNPGEFEPKYYTSNQVS